MISLSKKLCAFGVAGALCCGAMAAEHQDLSQVAQHQLAAIAAEKTSRTPAQRKIDSGLLMAIKAQRQDPSVRGIPLRNDARELVRQPSTTIEISAIVTHDLLNAIEAKGGSVIASHQAFDNIRADMPLQAIEQLAQRSDVRRIRRPSPRQVRGVTTTSEGVNAHGANLVQDMGIDGTGTKLCVISDGVDNLPTNVAAGELPANVEIVPTREGTGTEGTAMLEIVHDMAPGATLGFASAGESTADFAAAIGDLVEAGCHVIIDDIGFPTSQPAFEDDIVTNAANMAVMGGVPFFSAGGNDGSLNKGTEGTSGVWEGFFNPSGQMFDGGGTTGELHSFFGGDTTNNLLQGSDLAVLWIGDPLGAAGADYDFCEVSPDLSQIFGCSTNVQDGTGDPLEWLGNVEEGNALIVVKEATAAIKALHVALFNESNLEYGTTGRLFGHPGGEYVIGVAAVDARQAQGGKFIGIEEVESFSSDGRRRIFFNFGGTPANGPDGVLRDKPDLSAADNVVTTTPGFERFPGTSAAAPHAGAIAGLMLQANNALTPAQIKQTMIDTAWDIEGVGFDVNAGHGLINAHAAVAAVMDDGDGNGDLPGPNLVKNGDFIKGRTYWRKFSNGTLSFGVAGRRANLMTTAPGSNAQLFQAGIQLHNEAWYELTFWAREPMFGRNMRIRVHQNSRPHATFLYRPLDVTSAGSNHKFYFKTPADVDLSDVRVQFQIGTPFGVAGSRHMVDNVVMRQIADPNGH